MDGRTELPIAIRPFQTSDADACRQLYVDGLLGGKIAANDTGLDIDDIEAAYLTPPGNGFWIADASGEVVGMIGVQRCDDEGSGEIRRLRVRQDLRRRGIGSKLVETAIEFCNRQGYLKITLDTFMEREPALRLFEKFQFRHGKTRNINGKDLQYFYLDLYTRPGI